MHLPGAGNRDGSVSALDCRTVRQRRLTSSFRLDSPARNLPTLSRTAALLPRHRLPVASPRWAGALSQMTRSGPGCFSFSCVRKATEVPLLLLPYSSIHSTSPVSRHTAE